MISNFLFKGQTQAIKITNPNFAQKVRWDETRCVASRSTYQLLPKPD